MDSLSGQGAKFDSLKQIFSESYSRQKSKRIVFPDIVRVCEHTEEDVL